MWWTARYNYLCSKCGKTDRRRLSSPAPCCNHKMIPLGYRWRVPKKNDKNGWKQLEKAYNEVHSDPYKIDLKKLYS